MKTVKHYNFEIEVSENDLEHGATTLKYDVEKIEVCDYKNIIVSLPKSELVSLIEAEVGKKSLKWFEGLYRKLEVTILELH